MVLELTNNALELLIFLSPSPIAGITGLVFFVGGYFCFEAGSHYLALPGLKLVM